MNLRGILLGTAVAVILPTAAMAAPEGFYVGIHSGAVFSANSTVTDSVLPALWSSVRPTESISNSSTVNFNTGYAVGGFVGYATAMGLRGELEVTYRSNDVNTFRTGVNSGSYRSLAFMGNAIYDINTGTNFIPYIGAGVGVAALRDRIQGTAPGVVNYNMSGSDTQFAYQGIAGVAYQINQNLALTLDYRYFATTDARINANYTVTSVNGRTSSSASTSEKVNYGTHNAMVGLRYSFGAPAATVAPPAPPAAQLPQTEFLVFFDWDKANITPVSDKIIADAAAAAGKMKAVGIHVIGHTDTSGSPAYNQKLSVRRAQAVQKSLVTKGVPARQITIEGKGQTQLLVKTGPNVREPSNRRAQILISVR